LRKFHDGPACENIDGLAALRNGAVHGGISDPPGTSYRDSVERWDKAEPMRDLAWEVLINYLGHIGVIPVQSRPVRRRAMIPGYGSGLKVEPIDDSATLAKRGVRWDNPQ
jgi:hypothetical protein